MPKPGVLTAHTDWAILCGTVHLTCAEPYGRMSDAYRLAGHLNMPMQYAAG